MVDDQSFEVYLRTSDGETYRRPLRESKRISVSRGAFQSMVGNCSYYSRNAWDQGNCMYLDAKPRSRERSIECMATIQRLDKLGE